jgi:hypothetical protein
MTFYGFDKHGAVLTSANLKGKPPFQSIMEGSEYCGLHFACCEMLTGSDSKIESGTLEACAPHQSPHFAPASEMLERLRSREAKYASTKGALLIRVRLAGISRREKIAKAILLRGTLFSP